MLKEITYFIILGLLVLAVFGWILWLRYLDKSKRKKK